MSPRVLILGTRGVPAAHGGFESFAEKLAMNVARLVVTTGGPVALSVVNVLSLPCIVPALLMATIRK